MVYSCACPTAKLSHELGAERKRISHSSTAATPEILNHVTLMDKGNK
jgi:hypothetical protein